MLKEAMVDGPEIRSSGVVIFPDILDKFPPNLRDKHLLVQERVHQGYLKQKEVGFYPPDMAEQEWEEALRRNPNLAANNTLVRRKWWDSRLEAVSYRSSGFRFDYIADGLMDMQRVLELSDENLTEKSLVERQIKILANGFRTGDTDRAMEDYLNLRRHPKYGIWCGFLDRLLDKDRNLKFALQGWSTEQDEDLSQSFNLWSRLVLRGVNRSGYSDFLFSNVAIQSGLATERIWQANTQPSQPQIAERVGHLINFFDNVSAWKTARDMEPRLKLVTPEEMLDRIRRETLDRVRRAVIAGHEVGHAAQIIPNQTDRRLGRWYQVMREMYADAFGTWSIIKHPTIIISQSQLPKALYFDLARSKALIDEHIENIRSGNVKEDITNPYPYAVSTKINTLLAEKAISRNSAGVYGLGEMNQIRDTLLAYLEKLDRLVNDGSQAEVEDFIMERSSSPIDFFRAT